MLITTEGIVIRTPVSGISVLGRPAAGVKLMRTEDTVASIAKVRDEEPSGEDTGEADSSEPARANSGEDDLSDSSAEE